MNNLKYINDIVEELLSDEEWNASEDCKSMLCWGITTTLLDL